MIPSSAPCWALLIKRPERTTARLRDSSTGSAVLDDHSLASFYVPVAGIYVVARKRRQFGDGMMRMIDVLRELPADQRGAAHPATRASTAISAVAKISAPVEQNKARTGTKTDRNREAITSALRPHPGTACMRLERRGRHSWCRTRAGFASTAISSIGAPRSACRSGPGGSDRGHLASADAPELGA